ncbi:TPA: hypothetical protein NJ249_004131 [Vibrio parahaemolyticus]|nr:hypothetical protein [Vibrio parahaemolyticus]
MKVHAFKVEKSEGSTIVTDIFQQIQAEDSLRNRIRIINKSEIRVESIEERDGLWYIDFVRIRTDHGPGNVTRNNPIRGFAIDEDGGFGEETAALYDPNSGYMLIQYNHYGVRAGIIAEYFSQYDQDMVNIYTLKPKFDEDVERRLMNKTITKKLAFTIDVSRMTARDREEGQALSDAIAYGHNTGADKIKIEISVSGDKGRSLGEMASDGLTNLKTIFGNNPDAVSRLEFSGKDDRDSATEVLDLIGQRLTKEFKNLNVGTDLRYPKEARWDALLRTKNSWNALLR